MKSGAVLVLFLGVLGVFGVLIFAGLQSGYINNLVVLRDGSNPLTANWDIGNYYILYFEQQYWLMLDLEEGVTDHSITSIPSGIHTQDQHFAMIMISADTAPGGGKTVSFSITDGTSTMTVSITGAETFGSSTANAFDLDVSAETLTMTYSQTGGGATNHMCAMIHWYYKENA